MKNKTLDLVQIVIMASIIGAIFGYCFALSIETRGYIPCVTIDHYQTYTLFKDNHAPKVEPISLSVEDVAIARATQAKVQYVFDMLHSSIWEK
jgi:hypothetical protein